MEAKTAVAKAAKAKAGRAKAAEPKAIEAQAGRCRGTVAKRKHSCTPSSTGGHNRRDHTKRV